MFHKLLQKEGLSRQAILYLLAAAAGLAVDYLVLITTKELFGFHYLLAGAAGFLCGLAVVYALSNRYVFGEQKISSNTQNFLLFAVIGLVGLGLLSFLMWLFTGGLGLNYTVSKTIATVFVFIWNFLARRSLYN